MKRLLLITLLAVAVFAGCEVEDADSDRDNDRRTEEASDDRPGAGAEAAEAAEDEELSADDLPAEQMEMIFLTVLRDQEPGWATVPDEQIFDIAHETCAALDRGVTIDEIAITGIAEGSWTPTELGAMTGGAIAAFCPEYQDEMDDFADRWS